MFREPRIFRNLGCGGCIHLSVCTSLCLYLCIFLCV